MKVVILCGGQGTRLREETEFRPKPMVEIGGRPILWHIMKIYSYYGYHDFILCLGYKGNLIREYFMHYEFMNNDITLNLGSREGIVRHSRHAEANWNVTLVDTGALTPKAGRLLRIAEYLDDGPFMLTYGDGVADLDVDRLLAFHKSHGRMATFTGVRPRSRFATVRVDEHDRVIEWKEKRQLPTYINAGFFVMEPGVLQYLQPDQEIEEEPLEVLASKGEICMYRHDGFWECMDTYREYMYLNNLYETDSAPWAIWKDVEN